VAGARKRKGGESWVLDRRAMGGTKGRWYRRSLARHEVERAERGRVWPNEREARLGIGTGSGGIR